MTQRRAVSHKTLTAACRVRAAAINAVDIATADEAQCVAELNALDMDTMATVKNQLAVGAQTLLESATRMLGLYNILDRYSRYLRTSTYVRK